MTVAFYPAQEAVRGDLDIFLTDSNGVPTNPFSITYSIYYQDPGPPAVEVLIGAGGVIPVNPAVGEFYAALMVPTDAIPGTYRLKWTIQDTAVSVPVEVVQEFAVIKSTDLVASPYSDIEADMIRVLRVMLRDNCVGAEETVELDVDGEMMVVRMDGLWEALNDLSPPPPTV